MSSHSPLISHILSENFRQIQERVTDRLLDLAPEYEGIQPNFYLTSVYDHSLREAFSRVLHKLIDSLPYLEDMLNVFCAVRLRLITSKLITYKMRSEFSITESIPLRQKVTAIHCDGCISSGQCYAQLVLRLP